MKKFSPLPRMHRSAGAFLEFLADYEPEDKATVALEFVAGFILEGDAKEIIAALGEVSPEAKEQFLASVRSAPTNEMDWDQLRFVGANMNEADEARARDYWRQCVTRVRLALSDPRS